MQHSAPLKSGAHFPCQIDQKKKLTFFKKRVDFLAVCDILFSVMRDMISCEEVFEADPQARAEFDAVCDEWQDEAILAQDIEEVCWCKFFESCPACFGKK